MKCVLESMKIACSITASSFSTTIIFPRPRMTTLSSIRGSISRQLRIQNVSCTTSPIRSLATISNSTPTPSSFSSSSSSSSSWVAPIKPNTEPAYDSALRYLEHFSNKTLEKARSLEKELHQSQNHKEKEELEAKIEKLRIAAEINHPRTRWEFENGKADLSLPVHRHLREQAWRKGGSLDKLTERITLQHVIPDLIPTITPTVDLQVFFGEGTGIGDHSTENCTGEVLAGVKVEPFKTFFQDGSPKIVATPFHPEEKRYTLMMIDLDVPNEAEEGFGTFCHWLINDISLSSTKTSPSSTELSSAVLPFIPVHPTEGSGLHRYAFLLLSQSQNFSSSQSSSIERENFDVRAYVEEKGLRAEGIHFFRSAWKKEDAKSRKLISQVWRDVRGLPEPKYGRAPRVDRLKDVFGEKESRYY